MAMTWSDADVRAAYFCTAEVVRTRRLKGQPIPSPLRDLNGRLEAEFQGRLSRSRQQLDCGGEELESDKRISAAEAAMILGWTKRTVQRRASDLDGEIVGNCWVFSQSVVVEYAEGMRSARSDEGSDRAAPV